jgi:uncharacterized membrane protein (UPF0182 family)
MPEVGRRPNAGCVTLVVVAVLLLIGARSLSSWVLDYQWWRELGHVDTWIAMWIYAVGPGVAVALIAFVIFWTAHARGLKASGTGLRDHRWYTRLLTLGTLVLGILFAAVMVDSWTAVRFFGGHNMEGGDWRDPAFARPLSFYLFDLPFYSMLLRIVLGLCIAGAIVYYLTRRGWQLSRSLPELPREFPIELPQLRLGDALESKFVRALVAVFMLAFAVNLYLDRFQLVFTDHGFMVGVDWVNENVTIPLIWFSIAGVVAGAGLLWAGLWRWGAAVALIPLFIQFIAPRVVSLAYVKPNELAIQRSYIHRHIEATRQAYGLNTRAKEEDYEAHLEGKIDVAANRPLLDNIRLWDWRAFHDTLSQIQPLRPYLFSDTDVDRYIIDGALRQVMVSPRELDLNQLGDAQAGWINTHFVYTHGYGLVMAEANRITPDGRPVLFIKDAPPEITTSSLKVTRPELYYGEVTHEPVFVETLQPEFNYPSGADNVHTTYSGKGGFPISGLPLRLAAAINYGDWNILLTGQLGPRSRMMIHQRIEDRLATLAGFLQWDADPYLVLSKDGQLVWVVDGYLTSDAHPYSRSVNIEGFGSINYIRNSVKATVDAYDGTVHLYVFDPADPLVRAYRNLFPGIFTDAAAMPADLRAHMRYPETIFRTQAEIYRTFHMRDADAFYNKADLWDIARGSKSQEGTAQSMVPSYMIAQVPGSSTPEFLLMVQFTPRNKDNLIGIMAARCDGDHLGELVFLLLSKQELLLGPMQVEARMNQDQNISKDLTLWNQQGSQVLRGQMQVLPIDHTFLYVEPIYIQAREARMPQMKKVVLGVGNTLIYSDNYQEALGQLAAMSGAPPPQTAAQPGAAAPSGAPPTTAATGADQRINSIRDHLRRYRDLSAQGRWSEAGRELEAIESLVKR